MSALLHAQRVSAPASSSSRGPQLPLHVRRAAPRRLAVQRVGQPQQEGARTLVLTSAHSVRKQAQQGIAGWFAPRAAAAVEPSGDIYSETITCPLGAVRAVMRPVEAGLLTVTPDQRLQEIIPVLNKVRQCQRWP